MIAFAQRMSSVHRSFIREILKVTEDKEVISFAGGLPNPKFFPITELAEAARRVLESDGASTLQYATTEGFPPLRETIAHRYGRKGIRVSPEEILIVNGSQQGLDLIAKTLLDKGDTVAVEKPTYLAAIQAFGMFEPTFRGIALEEDGPSLNDLSAALTPHPPKFFYSIPNFQNPSGISWSAGKRRGAAELLSGCPTVLVEDDPYGDLRFMGVDLPPIRSFAEKAGSRLAGSILLGSFSKIVSPGLRIGWVCAEPEIMERLVIAKQASDLHSNVLSQRIVYRFLTDNDVDAHIARIKAGYKTQRDLMVDLAGRLFPAEVGCTKPEGGMFLWMTLPPGVSSLELFERAMKRKVAFVPGQAFFPNGGGENTLRLNFSNSDPTTIVEGMQRLASVYQEMRPGP